ncbi:MAG: hypothetical protein ACR2HC_08660 [Thermoleophilaceae bacterium]
MRTNRKLLAVLGSAIVFVSPSTALAQSAGDQQYADPLGSDNTKQAPQPNSGAQDNSGTTNQGNSGTTQGSNQLAGSGSSAPAPSTKAGTAARAAASPGSKQLPRTGVEVVMFVVTGFVLTLTGLVMHRMVTRTARYTYR